MGDQNIQSKPINRRAVAKGIAWSVPAMALATAAPALAQSPLVEFDPTGLVCKYSGGSTGGVKQAYLFPVTVTNMSNEQVEIKAVSARVTLDDSTELSGKPSFWDGAPHRNGTKDGDGKLVLDEGKSGTWNFVIDDTGNSAESAGTVSMTVTVLGKETGRTYTTTIELHFASSPPCKDSAI